MDSVFGRLVLLSLGFFLFEDHHRPMTFRESLAGSSPTKRSFALGPAKTAEPVEAGDLVLANHLSYLDIIYLCMR